jgi:hemoglobin
MTDISNKGDIEKLVNDFYGKVLDDDLLKPFFEQLNFKEHLPKMVSFWEFVLLDKAGYTTNVTDKHLRMPLKKEHFDHWIHLFNSTVDELFQGDKAEMSKKRAYLLDGRSKIK